MKRRFALDGAERCCGAARARKGTRAPERRRGHACALQKLAQQQELEEEHVAAELIEGGHHRGDNDIAARCPRALNDVCATQGRSFAAETQPAGPPTYLEHAQQQELDVHKKDTELLNPASPGHHARG